MVETVAASKIRRPFFHAQAQYPDGTGIIAAAIGANIRELNTVVTNTIPGASLAANEFTLPIGDYYIEVIAQCRATNTHRIVLQNVTDATEELLGLPEDDDSAVTTSAKCVGRFSVTGGPKNFNITHWCQTTGSFGNVGPDTFTEIQLDVRVWQHKPE